MGQWPLIACHNSILLLFHSHRAFTWAHGHLKVKLHFPAARAARRGHVTKPGPILCEWRSSAPSQGLSSLPLSSQLFGIKCHHFRLWGHGAEAWKWSANRWLWVPHICAAYVRLSCQREGYYYTVLVKSLSLESMPPALEPNPQDTSWEVLFKLFKGTQEPVWAKGSKDTRFCCLRHSCSKLMASTLLCVIYLLT